MNKYSFYVPRVHVTDADFIEDAQSLTSRLLIVWYALVNLFFCNQPVISKPRKAGFNAIEFFLFDEQRTPVKRAHVRVVAHMGEDSRIHLSRFENGVRTPTGFEIAKEEK